MKNYEFLGKSNGGRFCIDGIDVFSHQWQSEGQCEIVLDPETKRPYSFSQYKIVTKTKTITFLAGRFYDENWAFYQLKNEG